MGKSSENEVSAWLQMALWYFFFRKHLPQARCGSPVIKWYMNTAKSDWSNLQAGQGGLGGEPYQKERWSHQASDERSQKVKLKLWTKKNKWELSANFRGERHSRPRQPLCATDLEQHQGHMETGRCVDWRMCTNYTVLRGKDKKSLVFTSSVKWKYGKH